MASTRTSQPEYPQSQKGRQKGAFTTSRSPNHRKFTRLPRPPLGLEATGANCHKWEYTCILHNQATIVLIQNQAILELILHNQATRVR